MLSSRQKLPLRQDRDFFKSARKYRGIGYLLYFQENTLTYSRGAVVVPKHIVSEAVSRNTIKRILLNRLACAFNTELPKNLDITIVFLSRANAVQNARVLGAEIQKLLLLAAQKI